MTTGLQARRARFLSDGVATSPQALLVRLYDRLLLDLDRAAQAQRDGVWATANRNLQHAQQIVVELAQALDTEVWPEGKRLASVYSWVLTELVAANVGADAARTQAVRDVIAPLADAWRQAAGAVATPSAPADSAPRLEGATA